MVNNIIDNNSYKSDVTDSVFNSEQNPENIKHGSIELLEKPFVWSENREENAYNSGLTPKELLELQAANMAAIEEALKTENLAKEKQLIESTKNGGVPTILIGNSRKLSDILEEIENKDKIPSLSLEELERVIDSVRKLTEKYAIKTSV